MSVFTVINAKETYQRNESKLILVLIMILSIYLLAFAAKITWSMLPEPQSKLAQLQAPQITDDSSSRASNNISNIINQNLFGNADKPAPVATLDKVSDAPQTQLNLILSGVVSSNDPNRSAAIIEYRNNQSTYGVGDKIEGTNVTLDKIYVDRVIIKNRVTRETLMLDGIDFDEANKKRADETFVTSANTQPFMNSPSKPIAQNQNIRNQAQALRDARRKLAQEPASFTDMISLSPHRVNGVFIGFKVTPGSQPTLFNSVGLQNGDVVVQLNGLDLSDLQQSREAITELQQAESLQLEVLRGNEYVSLDLDISEASGNE